MARHAAGWEKTLTVKLYLESGVNSTTLILGVVDLLFELKEKRALSRQFASVEEHLFVTFVLFSVTGLSLEV